MQIYLIFIFLYICIAEENSNKNCYFYDKDSKYLYDCRNLQLFPQYYIETSLFYLEDKENVKGILYFDFQKNITLDYCNDIQQEQFSVIFQPFKESGKPCKGLLSSYKDKLQINFEHQEFILSDPQIQQITVRLTCSKIVVYIQDPYIDLKDDVLNIVSRQFCGIYQRNAQIFERYKILICLLFFISSLLICLNGLFHDNLVKCIISIILGYFFVFCSLNIIKNHQNNIEVILSHSISFLTAIFFALLVIQFKFMYKALMGFTLGFFVSSIFINLFFTYEEFIIYLITWICALIMTGASIYFKENFVQKEICVIGSFMFVYSIYFFFMHEYTAFDYNIQIKSGKQRQAKDFIVFGVAWIIFIFYYYIEYKIRLKKNQKDFEKERVIIQLNSNQLSQVNLF